MPVLLRSVGFNRSNNNRGLRIGSQQLAAERRRVSQASGTTSSQAERVRQGRTHEKTEEEEVEITWGQRFHKLYKKYHFKYLLPLIFIMFYMLIGAFIFYFLESGAAEDVATEEDYKYKRERRLLLLRMEEIVQDTAARRRSYRKKALEEAIDNYEQKLDFSVKNESQWTFASAMYFAGTLFTTIGYGDIACLTTSGRIATVIYSCVGIPFMLITLNDLGKFLYNNINGCVKEIEDFKVYLGAFRIGSGPSVAMPKIDELITIEAGETQNNEVSSLASEAGSIRNESDIENIEDEEERSTPRMSVKVALGITIGWIFFCSALFKLWEDEWTYAESCYFMFISLSTIGLGDLSVTRRDMMVLCFVFVIVGLSLVSMTINVIQVALEDFYVNLMMKLIVEYQAKLAADGDQMGASVGMMRMWGNNRTAKLLMPLLSKEKKKMAMEKVEVKAKNSGIEIPTILTDLDEKTGMPKLFQIDEKNDGEAPSKILEDLVQKQIEIEEAAAESASLFLAHDANTQTDVLQQEEKGFQTEEKQYDDLTTQTDVEEKHVENMEVETQTETVQNSISETQTTNPELKDEESNTLQLCLNTTDSQTEQIQIKDEELQTYIDMIEAETSTEIETKNIRIQTPHPIIEQKCVQTEDLEERKSPSKMSSAKKRLRRAFASKSKPKRNSLEHPVMSDWKDVEESEVIADEDEDEEEAGSVESLHWDPVDGMHAEKQLPVKKLTAMFDSPKGVRKIERKYSSFNKKLENSRSRNKSE